MVLVNPCPLPLIHTLTNACFCKARWTLVAADTQSNRDNQHQKQTIIKTRTAITTKYENNNNVSDANNRCENGLNDMIYGLLKLAELRKGMNPRILSSIISLDNATNIGHSAKH